LNRFFRPPGPVRFTSFLEMFFQRRVPIPFFPLSLEAPPPPYHYGPPSPFERSVPLQSSNPVSSKRLAPYLTFALRHWLFPVARRLLVSWLVVPPFRRSSFYPKSIPNSWQKAFLVPICFFTVLSPGCHILPSSRLVPFFLTDCLKGGLSQTFLFLSLQPVKASGFWGQQVRLPPPSKTPTPLCLRSTSFGLSGGRVSLRLVAPSRFSWSTPTSPVFLYEALLGPAPVPGPRRVSAPPRTSGSSGFSTSIFFSLPFLNFGWKDFFPVFSPTVRTWSIFSPSDH